MAKLKNPFSFEGLGLEKPQDVRRPYLSVNDLDKLPKWNEVEVHQVGEPKTQTGVHYTLITYYATQDNWQTKIGYFSSRSIYPIAQLFKLESISDTDELLGKKFFVSFGVRSNDETNKKYIEITDYTLNPRETEDTKQQGDKSDDIPF